MVASGTPCDASATVSFSGKRVAAILRRRSRSAASGILIRNGRMMARSVGTVGAMPGPRYFRVSTLMVGSLLRTDAAGEAGCADPTCAAAAAVEQRLTRRRHQPGRRSGCRMRGLLVLG